MNKKVRELFKQLIIGGFILLSATSSALGDDDYGDGYKEWVSTDDFLSLAFPNGDQKAKVLWLTPELKNEIEDRLDRKFSGLRIRYWANETREAWILEQIGKERLITSGFIVENLSMVATQVLTYRETRGDEIRFPVFLNQFKDVRLNSKKKLDRTIDGITGATLSVRAMKKMASAALTLSEHIQNNK